MDTKAVFAGNVQIGGGAPVTVQSMTNTDTRDAAATIAQIRALADAGAEIVRVSVYDETCARNVRALVDESPVPLVADIHFDHRLAIEAVENGIAKVRINPGNIGGEKNVRPGGLPRAQVPVRIGVNAGSLSATSSSVWRRYRRGHGGKRPQPRAHAREVRLRGHRALLQGDRRAHDGRRLPPCRPVSDYPQHIGVTESGTADVGIVKSAVGIGALLLDGIGDTIRVSLSGDPVQEVPAGLSILRACGLRRDCVEIISCPTCGRTCIDVEGIARRVRAATMDVRKPIKVAVMGCIVNGPGEAREADAGVAGGKDGGALFVRGEAPRAVKGDLAEALIAEIRRRAANVAPAHSEGLRSCFPPAEVKRRTRCRAAAEGAELRGA